MKMTPTRQRVLIAISNLGSYAKAWQIGQEAKVWRVNLNRTLDTLVDAGLVHRGLNHDGYYYRLTDVGLAARAAIAA